jgi:hypothetical protein
MKPFYHALLILLTGLGWGVAFYYALCLDDAIAELTEVRVMYHINHQPTKEL